MKTKALVLIAVAVVAAAAVTICGTLIYPSFAIKKFEAEYLRPMYETYGKGENFTQYSTKIENGQLVENDYFSLMIPEGFSLLEEGEEPGTTAYQLVSEDKSKQALILITDGEEEEFPSLHQIDLYQLNGVKLPEPKNLEEGYEKLCGGYPDSLYEEYKYMALLDLDDFDSTDYDKAYAFCELATLKCGICCGSDAYVYENEEICGVLYISKNVTLKDNKQAFSAVFRFYDASYLNSAYSVEVITDSMDTVSGVINSITMK